jgi:hypothetical protein
MLTLDYLESQFPDAINIYKFLLTSDLYVGHSFD